MHKTIVVTPPRSEPVSLNEAKKQLRVTACNDDEHISNLIKVSRDRVEKFCNRFFTTQTVDIVYDSSLPDKYIFLFLELLDIEFKAGPLVDGTGFFVSYFYKHKP